MMPRDDDFSWMEGVTQLTTSEKVRQTAEDKKRLRQSARDEELDEWPEKHKAYNPSIGEEDTYPLVSNVCLPTSSEPFVDVVDDVDCLAGRRASINDDLYKKLRTGLWPWERRLDLHGHREQQAWPELLSFLEQAYGAGCRGVLVIHGKGPAGQVGVIKANISRWLRSHGTVLAYHSALAKHGGSGAVYVMIRKNKEIF